MQALREDALRNYLVVSSYQACTETDAEEAPLGPYGGFGCLPLPGAFAALRGGQ